MRAVWTSAWSSARSRSCSTATSWTTRTATGNASTSTTDQDSPRPPSEDIMATMVDNNPTLRRGHHGDGWVTHLQQLLSEAARQPVVEETDNFDEHTEHAVIEFQRYHSLKPDGVVGRKTWSALTNTDVRRDLAFAGPGEYHPDRNEMHFAFINAGSVELPVGDFVAYLNVQHEG